MRNHSVIEMLQDYFMPIMSILSPVTSQLGGLLATEILHSRGCLKKLSLDPPAPICLIMPEQILLYSLKFIKQTVLFIVIHIPTNQFKLDKDSESIQAQQQHAALKSLMLYFCSWNGDYLCT